MTTTPLSSSHGNSNLILCILPARLHPTRSPRGVHFNVDHLFSAVLPHDSALTPAPLKTFCTSSVGHHIPQTDMAAAISPSINSYDVPEAGSVSSLRHRNSIVDMLPLARKSIPGYTRIKRL